MIPYFLVACALLLSYVPCFAAAGDDPVLTKITLNEVELRRTHGDTEFAWDIDAWIGRDLDKLWIKTEGERADGDTLETEFQMLYSRAITAFWNLQTGWRGDPRPGRDWFVIGAAGLAPYFVHVDANVFIGGSGSTGFRLNADREFMLTQRWILAPAIELNVFAGDDVAAARGSGLSNFEAKLYVLYQLRRDLAPYAGIRWEQFFGDTRSILRNGGSSTNEFQFVVGLNAWF